MTASDIVTIDVKVAAPEIEITNVEFSVVSSETQGAKRSMRREIVKVL